jgi:Nucleotidyltransferase
VNPHGSSRPSGRAAAARGWSALHGFAPTHGIKDYDLAYFDPDDLTDALGAATQQRVWTVTTRSVASLPRGAALAESVVKPSEDQPDRRHVRDRGNGQCGGRR